MGQQKMGQYCYRDVFKICYRCIYSVVDFISAMYNKSKLISREAKERKTALVFLLMRGP